MTPDIATGSENLVFHVDDDSYAFQDADQKAGEYRKWEGINYPWGTGNEVSLKLTEGLTNATGDPTISGVPQVGMELEARKGSIEDADGLPSSAFPSGYTFEWVSVDDSDVETIVGSNSTYTVSASDEGSTIKVYVSFTDLAGNSEGPLPSAATPAVVPAAASCPADNNWCATMTVGTDETSGTLYGFSLFGYGRLDEPTIDYGPSFEVEDIYIFEPDGFNPERILVSLDAYVPTGTVFNLGGTKFTADVGRTINVGGYEWSRPANFAWIDGQEVTVSANLAPAPESATVDSTSLVLTHSEDLDTGSVPAASAYTVKVDGDAGTNPSTVSVGTRTVTLTLATAVIGEQMVTVGYDMPASNRLQDVSGRNAPAFADFAVTNNTDALVSNTHLTPTGHIEEYEAQSFETGPNTDGYTISAVDIWLRFVTPSSNTSVKIRKNNTDNEPGALVATLANPTSLTADSLNTFLPQDTITLDPSTTYWISVNEGISTSITVVLGTSIENAETGETGWSIGDDRLTRADETDSWHTAANKPLLIAIKGTAVSCDSIWCATLQVQDLGSGDRGCGNASDGNECTVYLSEDEFTHAMTDYSVTGVRVQSNGQLRLWMQSIIATESESLVLHVGSDTFAFEDANVKEERNRKWNGSGLSWSTGDAIELKLTETETETETETGNSMPTFTEGNTTSRSFDETAGNAAATTASNIGAPVAATDPDAGDTLTYTLRGADAAKFDVDDATGQIKTKSGQTYDYEAKAIYAFTVAVEDGNGGSDTITVILEVTDQNEPPLAPTPVFVSPTSGSASRLNVSWHPPDNTGRPNITSHDLQYREVGAANYRNGPQNVSGTRTTISGLRPGTVYQVQVRATNPEGDGVWTPAVERSTSQNSEPDPPAVTHGLRATGVSQTRIDLSWNAPTDDGGASITGYRIEIFDDGGSTWSDLVANTRSSSRTYAHTGLTAGVTRHYRVSAINRVDTGLASAVASGQTQAADAKPKRPSTMYLYFTVSNSDWNESEEVKYSGNRIDGDCSGEKYFRALWTEPNSPPVDEWEVRATPADGASAPRTQVRYSNGNREYPEFIGSAQFATGPGEGSSINFAVRGRYGDTWGAWGPTSVLRCNNTE